MRDTKLRDLAVNDSKLWAFNGEIGGYGLTLAEVQLLDIVVLRVWNDTAWRHSMHFTWSSLLGAIQRIRWKPTEPSKGHLLDATERESRPNLHCRQPWSLVVSLPHAGTPRVWNGWVNFSSLNPPIFAGTIEENS